MFLIGYFSLFFPFLLLTGIILILALQGRRSSLGSDTGFLSENKIHLHDKQTTIAIQEDCYRFEDFKGNEDKTISPDYFWNLVEIKLIKPIIVYFYLQFYSSDYHVKFFGLSPPL